jgi:hypothetical protein
VHHGVDLAAVDHLGDQRVADVGPDELRPAHPPPQIGGRRHGVHSDDPLDGRVFGQP